MENVKKGAVTLSYELRELVTQIEDRFEDHLIAINENTSELITVYEGLSEIDTKIEKLSERVEQIEHFLHKAGFTIEAKEKEYSIEPLTKKEKEIFLVIYTLNESGDYVSYADIGKKTSLPEDLACLYVSGMTQKGIPFLKKCIDNKVCIKIDDRFKEKQAKENLLGIEQRTIFATA